MYLEENSGNYYLNNDYYKKDFNVDFNEILGNNLNFRHTIYTGFLFYINKDIRNYYKIKLLNYSHIPILDIKFTNTNKKIVYDDYEKTSNYYYSNKDNIGIISIPILEIYKKVNKDFLKLDYDASSDSFNWKTTKNSGDLDDFKTFLRQQSGNTQYDSLFLTSAITEFKRKLTLKETMNANGKFKIDMKDSNFYIIDTKNVELTYNRSKPIKLKLERSNKYYAIIQDQDLINPEIKFWVTSGDIYITHSFDMKYNASMNFSGELRLDFEKDGNDLILNSDYAINKDVQDFLSGNRLAAGIIDRIFAKNGLTYNNYFEIYFGKDINGYQTLFFRPLDKNRKPIPYLNFNIDNHNKVLFLDNFDKGGNDQFVEFIIRSNYIYTENDVEIKNGKIMIILDVLHRNIYCFITSKKDGRGDYIITSFEYDDGYKAIREDDDIIIAELKDIADPTNDIPR
jgi:hypothetical protein